MSALLVCLPWTIRNHRVLGGFVPVRDNFGLELQVSNNDDAASSTLQNDTSLERFHPSSNPQQATEIRELGELLYNRVKMREATAWIVGNPRRFALLTLRRVCDFWFPPMASGPSHTLGIWIVTLLSLPAMFLAAFRRFPCAAALLWMQALAPLPFYVIQSDPRYRVPLLWISLLFAGYAVHAAIHWRARPIPLMSKAAAQ